jgi:hypothetical protein
MAKNNVHWFIVREKHCWLTEKIQLIRQANGAAQQENSKYAVQTISKDDID